VRRKLIRKSINAATAGLVTVLVLLLVLSAVAADVPRLTKEEVKGLLGKPDVTIIDVRAEGVQPGDVKIVGAVVKDPTKVEEWGKDFSKAQTLILYCS